jgi:hypothetical protein
MVDSYRADLVRHFGGTADARADPARARREMIDQQTSAWRMDARKRKPPPDDDDDDEEPDFGASMGDIVAIRAPAIAARDAYVRDLAQASASIA